MMMMMTSKPHFYKLGQINKTKKTDLNEPMKVVRRISWVAVRWHAVVSLIGVYNLLAHIRHENRQNPTETQARQNYEATASPRR